MDHSGTGILDDLEMRSMRIKTHGLVPSWNNKLIQKKLMVLTWLCKHINISFPRTK